MSFQERSKKILMILDEFESLSVLEISQKLAISPATVRRDLLDLSKEGFLLRTHGGAMKSDDLQITGFNKKQATNDLSKQAIGKTAAENVKNGDTIFMDCGSTVFTMCLHLKKFSKLKIITNSLPIVAELMNVPGISINLIGGELDAGRKAIHGEMAIQHIDNYHAFKAFIGIDGLSIEKGLTSHSEKEATITKALCRNADDVYLLCDSSKIGKDAYIKLGPLSIVKFLITDNQLSASLKNRISAKGITILQ
jgi:DeoR family fructose operon transcriptional repressor